MESEARKLAKQAYQKQYSIDHKEELREKNRLYYQQHPELIHAQSQKYYWAHADKIRANAVRTGKIVRKKQRLAVLLHYSNGTCACVKCGFSDIRALCLDHIKGGGTEQRRRLKNGGNVWFWLARHSFPPGYQILCANCNTIKAREEDEYGSDGMINADWRSQVTAQSTETWVGKHRTWEGRIAEQELQDKLKLEEKK